MKNKEKKINAMMAQKLISFCFVFVPFLSFHNCLSFFFFQTLPIIMNIRLLHKSDSLGSHTMTDGKGKRIEKFLGQTES